MGGPTRHGAAPRAGLSRAVGAAAALTTVIAVGADLLAGGHTAHVAVLGAVTLALGVARVRLAGRCRLLFAGLSAALVAPPVAHAAGVLVRPTPVEGSFHHLDADTATSIGHILLAVLVAAVVGAAESLIERAATALRAGWAALVALVALCTPAATPHGPRVVPPPAPVVPTVREAALRYALRRGPPVAAAA